MAGLHDGGDDKTFKEARSQRVKSLQAIQLRSRDAKMHF